MSRKALVRMAQPEKCHQQPIRSVRRTASSVPHTCSRSRAGLSSPVVIVPSGSRTSQLEQTDPTSSGAARMAARISSSQCGLTRSSSCSSSTQSKSTASRAIAWLTLPQVPELCVGESIRNGRGEVQWRCAISTVLSSEQSSARYTAAHARSRFDCATRESIVSPIRSARRYDITTMAMAGSPLATGLPKLIDVDVDQQAVPEPLQDVKDETLLAVEEAEPKDVAIEHVDARPGEQRQTGPDLLQVANSDVGRAGERGDAQARGLATLT